MKRVKKEEKLEPIKKHFKSLLIGEIFIDVIIILLGIFYCIKPEISINLTCKTIGIILMVSSLYAIVRFLLDKSIFFYKYDLVYGLVSLLGGLIIFIEPIKSSKLFMIGLAIWFILTSIRKLYITKLLHNYKDDSYVYSLVLSIIILLLGIIIIVNPLKATIAFSTLCGLSLIFYGAINITHMAMFLQYIKKFISYFKN